MASDACNDAGAGKKTEYKPKGKTVTVSEMPIYVVGSGKNVVIVVYDILGWGVNKNVFEFSDRLAESDLTVVMGDHFRGKPWPAHRIPFKDENEQKEFFEWMKTNASPEMVLKDLKDIVYPYIEKELKFSKFFGIGFCWGGGLAFEAASNPKFIGVGCVHGARFTDETLRSLKCPVYYAPTPRDMTCEAVKKQLDETDYGKKSVYHSFDKMEHGFCGGRGDWTNADIKKSADMVIEDFVAFCKDNSKS